MHKTFTLVASTILFIGLFSSCRKSVPGGTPEKGKPGEIVETQAAVLSKFSQDISTNVKGYYQAVPARYNETTKNYPLIVFFHGGGQYGNGTTDLDTLLAEGTPKLLKAKTFPPSFTVNNETFSFILVAPQFVMMPRNTDVAALLTHIRSKFRIDTSRIYLLGFSLGGRMLSNYAASDPTHIAAIASMAGLPEINSALNAKCMAMMNARLPVWHVHNKDDGAWTYSDAVQYINYLNKQNPVLPPKFTSFDVGEARLHHDCWTRTMDPAYKENGKNVYEWMLSYKR